MAKQTFTTGQVLTAAQMTSLQQTAMGGGSTTAKTTSYVLTAADAGTVVQMNAAGATTITVNTALFAAGDTVQIQNIGAGVCTITAGTATVSTAGSLALSQYEGGQLYFNSTSAAIFFDTVQAGGAPTFVGCRLTGSDQSIPNNTQTAILWSTETFDTDGFHSTSSNTSRITIPSGKAGYYQFHFCAEYLASAAGNRYFEFRKNNTAFNVVSYVATGTTTSAPMTDIVNLAVGDYVEVFELQTSGGALTLYNSSPYGWFEATYLGA